MGSTILMAFSAGIMLLLGIIHLAYTFFGSDLLLRDPALRTAMSEVHLGITKETTVGRAWVGFNASHSMGLMLFGLIFGFLALYHSEFLFGSAYLLAVGFAMLAGFLVLARLYWFTIPFTAITISIICYVASIMAARGFPDIAFVKEIEDAQVSIGGQMEQVCQHCKSARLLRSAQVLSFGGGLFGGSYPVGIQGPMTSFKGNVQSTMSATVCVDCGHVRMQADDLDSLQKTYEKLQGDPALRLNL